MEVCTKEQGLHQGASCGGGARVQGAHGECWLCNRVFGAASATVQAAHGECWLCKRVFGAASATVQAAHVR
eukprot:1161775-Pelagomonas_calceolata.AAC.4